MKSGDLLFELLVDQEEARRERTMDDAIGNDGSELRPISARIQVNAYEVLERLSERWDISKSRLAARVLESALWDLENTATGNERS